MHGTDIPISDDLNHVFVLRKVINESEYFEFHQPLSHVLLFWFLFRSVGQ